MMTLLLKRIISRIRLCGASAVLIGTLFAAGCDSGGGGSNNNSNELGDSSADSASGSASSGTYPKVKGSWSGTYAVYGGSDLNDGQAVKARVQQDRDAVVIKTNLPTTGRLLTGSIDEDGDMRLTDAFDGELWTTHFEPATTTSMRIADFLERPTVESPDPPIAVLELRR